MIETSSLAVRKATHHRPTDQIVMAMLAGSAAPISPNEGTSSQLHNTSVTTPMPTDGRLA
ncbi:hypothetical protein D9M68_998480 [compost metagenome]